MHLCGKRCWLIPKVAQIIRTEDRIKWSFSFSYWVLVCPLLPLLCAHLHFFTGDAQSQYQTYRQQTSMTAYGLTPVSEFLVFFIHWFCLPGWTPTDRWSTFLKFISEALWEFIYYWESTLVRLKEFRLYTHSSHSTFATCYLYNFEQVVWSFDDLVSLAIKWGRIYLQRGLLLWFTRK